MHVDGRPQYESGYSAAIMSVGERTAKLSEQSMLLHTKKVRVVENVTPLYKALLASYQYGKEAGMEWMILIGADTVLDYDQTQLFLKSLKHYPADVFCVSAYLQCKLRVVPRTGVYAYRILHMNTIINAGIMCAKNIRPQGHMHNLMAQNGYRHVKNRIVVGIHDYEQYHYDIFRTAHLLAQKWPQQYVESCIERWSDDGDFATARLGVTQTEYNCTDSIPDIRKYDREGINALLLKNGIKEKRRLPENIKIETVMRRCNFNKAYR